MTDVEDIQSFIAAQKKRIEEERTGLTLSNVGRRNIVNHNYVSPKTQHDESTSEKRTEQPEVKVQETSSPSGLPLGSYESVQEQLRKERAEDYKKFLAEKAYRTTGRKSGTDKVPEKTGPLDDVPEHRNRPLDGVSDDRRRQRGRSRPEKTLDELYDAYEELLERKRQDERRYRSNMDEPLLDSRRVRFDDEFRVKPSNETWLQNGSRRRWEIPEKDFDRVGTRRDREPENVDPRVFEDYQDRSSRNRSQKPQDERISRSAPPTAVPLFGEHDMSPEVKQQRQTKYREELEAQIKEREMQKKREKNHTFIEDSPKANTNVEAPSIRPDLALQRYNPSLPGPGNPIPSSQIGFGQSVGNPFLRQPYNYPAGLYPSGPPLSSVGGPDTLSRYPLSFRDPLGGYQPSWASEPHGQRTSGLVTNGQSTAIGEVGARSSDDRRGQSTGVEKNLYSDVLSGIGALPHTDASREKERNRQQTYREELTRQMMEKEARRKKDKETTERYNMKLEREIAEYNPWGKSGGGAPIKDQSGRLISDLRKMHQYNKEGTIISPRDRSSTTTEPYLNREPEITSSNIGNTAATSTVSNQTSFGPTQIQTDDAQKKAQLEYKEYLRQQMEEKQKKKKEEEQRIREIEAREDKIIQEQQEKLRSEYQQELEAKKKKEESARLKNEEIRRAAEQKKKEMEQKRLDEDMKQEERLRKQLDERLKAAKASNFARSSSPPLPTSQGQLRSYSPPIPTLQQKREEQNRPSSPPIPTLQKQIRSNSPPIPTLRNKEDNRPSSPPIPTLQKQTRSNSPPIPTLRNKESEPSEQVSGAILKRQTSFDRHTQRPSSSAGNRWPTDHLTHSPVPSTPQHRDQRTKETRARPPSVTADMDVLSQLTSLRRQLKNEEIKVQQQLSENKEKYARLRENSGTRRGKKLVGNVFDNVLRKNTVVTEKDQDPRSIGAMQEFNKLKYEDSSSLHGDFISRYPDPATSTSTLDLQQKSLLKEQQKRLQTFRDTMRITEKENVETLGNNNRPTSKTSQLESDSQFVSVEDPSQVVNGQAETSRPSPGRISSARERRRWKQLEQLAKIPKLSDYRPPTPGGFSVNSVTSFNVDELAQKNEERLRRLEAMKQARSEAKGDPNEVLKKFIQQHSRPDSKVSENSLPADKRYVPNM